MKKWFKSETGENVDVFVMGRCVGIVIGGQPFSLAWQDAARLAELVREAAKAADHEIGPGKDYSDE